MSQLLFILAVISINLFPYVRRLLPQRDEDWLFELTGEHKNLVKQIHELLKKLSPYYNNLSPEGKKKFVKRIVMIIFKKTIVGYHDLKVTKEMAILVMAAQVQLTFGLKRFSLPHFKKIILYPDKFYSKYFGQHLQGLTSGRGFVTLSWAASLDGIKDPKDNLNLMLHEYAHALKLNNQFAKRSDKDAVFANSYEQHEHKASTIFEQLASRGKHYYLRDYAFTNEDEFFAVCVEHFFETPEVFKKELPALYRIMCDTLNQNPLNTFKDYQK